MAEEELIDLPGAGEEGSLIKILVERGGEKSVKFIKRGQNVKEVLKVCQEETLQIYDRDFGEFVTYDHHLCPVVALDKFKIVRCEDVPSTSASGATARSPSTSEPPQKRTLDFQLSQLKNVFSKSKRRSTKRKTQSTDVRIAFGWMNRTDSHSQYKGMRFATGGGTRTLLVDVSASYEDIKDQCKSAFFPDGKNRTGHLLKDFIMDGIGLYQSLITADDSFNLEEIIQGCGNPSRTRLYMFTTQKDKTDKPLGAKALADCETDSSDTDTDQQQLSSNSSELPDVNLNLGSNLGLSASLLDWQDSVHLADDHQANAPVVIQTGTPTITFKDLPSTATICHICADRVKDSFLVPCGHTVCLPCGLQINENEGTCPFCKVGIMSVKKLY